MIIEGLGANAANTSAKAIETTDERFVQDVIEASMDRAIVVDFWAPWCGPCKQIAPVLEKAVGETRGKVQLVKLNIDENPRVAQQLRVQSIPAVFGFVSGRPLDGFMGAQPPARIHQFVQSMAAASPGGTEDPADSPLERAAEAFAAGGTAEAAELFGAILRAEPDNAAALAGLARCYLQGGDPDRAQQILDSAPEGADKDPAIESARAALRLALDAKGAGSPDQHRALLDADPNNHQARYDLYRSQVAAGDPAAAVDTLLELFRRDRNWNDGAARRSLLEVFDAMGESDPVTVDGRRRLSSLLFS